MNNQNKIIITVLITIIVILSVLVILFATGTINFKSNDIDNKIPNQNIIDDNITENSDNNFQTDNNNNENNNEKVNENNNNNEINSDKVNIDLSIENVIVSKDGINSKIYIDGTIDLSYDNTKYSGIGLSGYCLGNENEKYIIGGPRDGRALFHNDENKELSLSENVPGNVEYPDGTVKKWEEINWENVKIKYCKIDQMIAISNDGTDNIITDLNFEKEFK